MYAFHRTAKRRKNVFLRQCAEQGSNPDSKIRAVEDNAVAEIGELNHLSVSNVGEWLTLVLRILKVTGSVLGPADRLSSLRVLVVFLSPSIPIPG
jgi:hypothetical protein